MLPEQVRELFVSRLVHDLVGPGAADETIPDRPTERYATGILYPKDVSLAPEEDEDGGGADDEESVPALAADTGAPLWVTRKPATMGLSFAVEGEGDKAAVEVIVRGAFYDLVDEPVQTINPRPSSKGLWQRRPVEASVRVVLAEGDPEPYYDIPGVRGLRLYVLTVRRDGLLTATIALINNNPRGDSRAEDEKRSFFQSEVTVQPIAPTRLAPRPSRRRALDEDGRVASLIYRDAVEYSVGHTCSSVADLDAAGAPVRVRTTWVPRAVVPATSEQGDDAFTVLREHASLQPLNAEWLSRASAVDLVAALRLLETAYRSWIDDRRAEAARLPREQQTQATENLGRCIEAADRIRAGIALIESDTKIRQAFQLASSAMALQYKWLRDRELSWRPFQLAFQLLSLASLAERHHTDRDVMDLLWFPTGGGKTEAYLGLTAFVLLLRRLRATKEDDGAGVAVLMRYTLRLLTIQQFQRASAMVLACELLRRKASRGEPDLPNLGPVPFSIGLWVGQGATPLTIKEARDRSSTDPSTPEQLTECPCCKARLDWQAWKATSRCFPVCCSKTCDLAQLGAELPVWTVDEDIYREAPSLVIATVDKFAQIVRKMESGVLFGRDPTKRSSPPDLIIQDELHLISGPLGTMTGLYETAIDALCTRDNVRPKIIGSTATIRRAKEQVQALFCRKTFQFPPPGLHERNSGFAVRDESRPGRLYLGVTTVGRSAKYVLQAVSASLLQSAIDTQLTPEERDAYWTVVSYFNSLRELGSAVVLVQDDVPVTIQNIASRRGESARPVGTPSELTSRCKSSEIRDMLDQLAKRSGDPDVINYLLASNMISVGIDIKRLGLMIVNAQPKSLSEYIQATSRVGRDVVPGLVVTIYNATRPRDRSHYETFSTWHATLYREVEATSVTPFASRAQDKALHAVLVALVRHSIPGLRQQPALEPTARTRVEALATIIEDRARLADAREVAEVSKALKELLDEWEQWWQPGSEYWNDYTKRRTLLMSAEQYAAAIAMAGGDDGTDGQARALWPTPNSMREVEPGTPFVLLPGLKVQGGA